jgi:hypothetical protein
MRFAFIHAEKANHAVRCLCRVLHVTRSGDYAWAKRSPSRRQREEVQLRARIRATHTASRGTYGSPRISAQLRQDGVPVGRERVARLLRDMGLVGLPLKRFRRTTDSDHQQPVAPNVLDRDFEAAHLNERWSTDITYIWTWEGWLYLAVGLDLCARRVVGWAVQPHLRAELALEALHMALGRRVPEAGLLHHSDRGSQYAADAYQQVLSNHRIVCSMSRKGDCWDNGVPRTPEGRCFTRDESRASRNRVTGPGSKPRRAAAVKSCGGERRRKGAAEGVRYELGRRTQVNC